MNPCVEIEYYDSAQHIMTLGLLYYLLYKRDKDAWGVESWRKILIKHRKDCKL